MTETLRLWFQGRSLREKRLLLVMVALAALALVWAGIILPVTDALDSARDREAAAVLLLAQTEGRVDVIKAIERHRVDSPSGPLDALIRARANEAGFALANVAAQGTDRVQITITSAQPGALMGWIAQLEQGGILVETVTMSDNGDKTVSVQASLKKRES